jgi:oligoribonuclease
MSQATDFAAAAPAQRPNEFNLVWVDMEMTGLDPDNDRIIEVAVVVTDPHLHVLAEGPVFAIHQSDEVLDKMDSWNKGTHGRSGLIDRVKVRQHDLPGPPLHGARHAQAGSVLPLP